VKFNFLKISIAVFPFVLAAVFFISGCKSDKIIDEEKFIMLYTDLVIAQDTSNADYNMMIKIRSQVLDRYKVTDEQYKFTIDYYNENPDRWQVFFEKVTAYVDNLKLEAAKKP